MNSDYYMWLLERVGEPHGSLNSYSRLMRYLFSTPFEYVLIMDQNRAKGGENLRSIYALEYGLYDEDVFQGPCSVLEMLIALADNLAFNSDNDNSSWFWLMLDNLGLSGMDDNSFDENYVSEKLHIWMNRLYDSDGEGSLFPLRNPSIDCRNIEIWDQMNAYLMENYPVGNWID